MPSYYRIKGLPGFEGLVANGEQVSIEINGARYDYLIIDELVNSNVVVGDRDLRFPMPHRSLLIGADCLEEIDDVQIREWTTDNPFGKFEFEGHYHKGTVHIDYAAYENALTINVKDTSVEPVKTVYSQNYFGDFRVDAQECVEHALREETDVDDLVFDLQAITAAQREYLKRQ